MDENGFLGPEADVLSEYLSWLDEYLNPCVQVSKQITVKTGWLLDSLPPLYARPTEVVSSPRGEDILVWVPVFWDWERS